MSTTLFVAGLSYSTTFGALREYFAQCGTVKSAQVITDPNSGRSRGFGFVEMSTEEEANAAISRLNGQMLDGRSLKVEAARPRSSTSTPGAPRARRGPVGVGGRGGRGRWNEPQRTRDYQL